MTNQTTNTSELDKIFSELEVRVSYISTPTGSIRLTEAMQEAKQAINEYCKRCVIAELEDTLRFRSGESASLEYVQKHILDRIKELKTEQGEL